MDSRKSCPHNSQLLTKFIHREMSLDNLCGGDEDPGKTSLPVHNSELSTTWPKTINRFVHSDTDARRQPRGSMTSESTMKRPSVILASGSTTRKELLERSGVDVEVKVPGVDEEIVAASLIRDEAQPTEIAVCLAEMKALRVGSRERDKIVVGCDQILWANGNVVHKSNSIDEARKTLASLRGVSHSLISAAVVVIDGERVWHAVSQADLLMRRFSDAFIESYLARNWPAVAGSVGCYRIEEEGVQLMARVRGDHFAIMGLPLIEILDYLRIRGALQQ